MNQEKVTVKCECSDCAGTGLYRGWTCHDGAVIVCNKCNGTGAIEFSYIPFTERKKVTGVKRVFANVEWHHVYPEKHIFDDGTAIDYSQFGCTYEEWEAGAQPKPIPDQW